MEESSRTELCQVVAQIHRQGWAQGTGGNFSVTVGHRPLRLLITQSGKDKGQVRERDLVLVDGKGRVADHDWGHPSAETVLHCVIAEERGAGATLHTHSVANTLLGEHFLDRGGFTISGYEMLKGIEGMDTHEARLRVPVLANSQDMKALAAEVRALLAGEPETRGFLLAGHGLYTWGEDLRHARRHVEIFEFLFECLARRVRFQPFGGE